MLFKSAYADFQVLVRSEAVNYHPATGVEISRIPALTANFGTHRGEFEMPDYLTGGVHQGAVIMGHFFDSEAAQAENGWTDEERESVEAAILKIAQREPYLVAPIEDHVPAVEKPWPSYDEQTAKEIVAVATSAGLIPEAIRYENENKQRSTLIAELEQLAARQPEPEVAEITL